MRFIFSLIIILSTNILFAQKNDSASGVLKDTSSKVFNKVEIEPSVDLQQWIEHLRNNLQSPIEKAAKKGMKPGTYTVQVKFLVERDGSIADVQALNDPGFGLAKAAVKTVKTGPRWKAGEVDGKKVRSYHTQPITFVIQEQ